MTKKELLIILVLAVLVTGLSWLITQPSNSACLPSVIPFGYLCVMIYLPTHMDHGYPVPYWKDAVHSYPGQFSFLNFGADLLFWFLILTASWWVLKIVLKKIKIKNAYFC